MKKYFPSQNGVYRYLQTNRSDTLGNLWSTSSIDFQKNPGVIKLSDKLVINTNSIDDSSLGLPGAFTFCFNIWWATCGSAIFKTSDNLITTGFTKDTTAFTVGLYDTQFDVTNPSGTTFRYTWDGTGTDPSITALTFVIGQTVVIENTNLAAGNEGTFTITNSGTNYFEITNASGVVEADKTIGASGGFISVTGGSLPLNITSDTSDLKVFNSRIWLTTNYGLYSRLGLSTPWVLQYKFSSTYSHKMAYSFAYDRLYFKISSRKIGSIDTSDVIYDSAGSYCLEIATNVNIITTFEAYDRYIYVGTQVRNVDSIGNYTNGSILEWDGSSSTPNKEYPINAAAILSIIQDENGVLYAMDSEGRLLSRNYAFAEVARLPIKNTLLKGATYEASLDSPSMGRFIHYNGMVSTKNGTLLLAINNLNDDASASINENMSSGIWEFDIASQNFTHKHPITYTRVNNSSVSDYGQNKISGIGAIEINNLAINSALGRSTIIAGATYYTNATDIASAIFINSPASPTTDTQGTKKGYFVTTWFSADDIADKWNKIWATYKRFKSTDDKIVFKYRLEEDTPIYTNVTWTTANTFTTTTDVSDYVGYEVEVIQGTGGGACLHITSVTEDAGTYTVTLEEEIPNITATTGKVRIQSWIKVLPEITGLLNSYEKMPIMGVNTRIQIKCCITLNSDGEFHKFVLFSNNEIESTA